MNISANFRETFAENFRLVPQQTNSRLRKTVINETALTGISKQIGFVNPVNSEETTGQRYKKVALQDLDTDVRWYYAREFQTPTGESKWDEAKLAPTIMPGGQHLMAHTNAFRRDCDSVIMTNLLGDARTGLTGETATPLPASQIVPVDFVATGSDVDSSITVPKIIEAIRILKGNEAWNEDRRADGIKLWGVMDSDLEAKLKQQANATDGGRLFSKDFDPPTYDKDGTLIYWLGVNWVQYERLLTGTAAGASGDVSVKKAAIWTTDAFEFGIWDDLRTSVDIRPDLSNAVQYLSQYRLGGGRTQEKYVVQINNKI